MLRGYLKSWLIWFVAGLFYLFEFIHRVVVSVMIPELSESFEVGSALLSSLSAAYFFSYALAQVPVGILIDRYGTRLPLTLACLSIALSTFVFGLTPNINVANFSRVVIGLGSAFAFVGCLKLAATWFPAHRFAFVVGLTNMFGVIGAVVGGAPTAYAVTTLGWRNTMYIVGLIGLLLSYVLWSIIRDNKRYKPNKSSDKSSIFKNLDEVLQNKQTWLIAIFASCMVSPIITYSELWGVTYLVNAYNIERTVAAQISTITFLGIAIGGPTIGWLSDYYRNRTYFMGIGLTGALISISIILFGPTLSLGLVLLLHVCFGFFTSSMLLCFSLNAEETKPKIRATTVALTNCVIMIVGAELQKISGELLEYTSNNFTISFIPLISCYVLAIICYIFIKEPPCKFSNQ